MMYCFRVSLNILAKSQASKNADETLKGKVRFHG